MNVRSHLAAFSAVCVVAEGLTRVEASNKRGAAMASDSEREAAWYERNIGRMLDTLMRAGRRVMERRANTPCCGDCTGRVGDPCRCSPTGRCYPAGRGDG
jgi:hypothetical protein